VKKKVYLVAIDRTVTKMVTIEAESEDEAEKAVDELLEDGEIDMDEYDFFESANDNIECLDILPNKIEETPSPSGPVEIRTDEKGRRFIA
jgi:cellulose biosynthesis protein BcsQ